MVTHRLSYSAVRGLDCVFTMFDVAIINAMGLFWLGFILSLCGNMHRPMSNLGTSRTVSTPSYRASHVRTVF